MNNARRYNRPDRAVERIAGEVLSTIDREAFQMIASRHADENVYPGRGKYLDLEVWIRRHALHATALGLHRRRKLRVLDLGTGTGYFPYVCAHLGHDPVGLDLDTTQMFNEIVEFLGVTRICKRIEAKTDLGDLDGPYDVVTAFNTSFDRLSRSEAWGFGE